MRFVQSGETHCNRIQIDFACRSAPRFGKRFLNPKTAPPKKADNRQGFHPAFVGDHAQGHLAANDDDVFTLCAVREKDREPYERVQEMDPHFDFLS